MGIKSQTCYTAVCDVCGSEMDEEYGTHWSKEEDAAQHVRDCDWAVSWSREQVVCDTEDEEHRAPYAEVAASYSLQHRAWWLEKDHARKRELQACRGEELSPEMDHETALKIAAWQLEHETEGCDHP